MDDNMREHVKESGYKVVARRNRELILYDPKCRMLERWYANKYHAGYTILYGNTGYEFGSDVFSKDADYKQLWAMAVAKGYHPPETYRGFAK